MSAASDNRSAAFLAISSQFQLGALVTESSHPRTVDLSAVVEEDIAKGLERLFRVDDDVVARYGEFARSNRAGEIKETVLRSLRAGGRMFFAGCGSTGRLSIQLVSIWRDFWRRRQGPDGLASTEDWENRALSVMAGGDFALIKSVEGFEDYAAFGGKQLGDLAVGSRDVVFAITEGGETSFVIGAAWKGVEAGAKVYFVYNNPDDLLCRLVDRSRAVIEDPRIEKINLTTGPMAITGSTRMQATSIQLCVLLTVLEMVVRDLTQDIDTPWSGRRGRKRDTDPPPRLAPEGASLKSSSVPEVFLAGLEEMVSTLQSPAVRHALASLVALEASVYGAGGKNQYFADRLALDVLTDTTERSPTFCTPPFRKFDDSSAAESMSFLFLPCAQTPAAWEHVLKREPRCIEWSRAEVRELAGEDKAARLHEIVRNISRAELMRFRIGLDGLAHRPLGPGDSAIAVLLAEEKESLMSPAGFYGTQLAAAAGSGASVGMVCIGEAQDLADANLFPRDFMARAAAGGSAPGSAIQSLPPVTVLVPVPRAGLLLNGLQRVGAKMLLNALSTCTMVRLGRVMGNRMIWVVPSNLKLIDRATRYLSALTALSYETSNRLLFEVIEYLEPQMRSDRAHPPAVGLAVLRHRHHWTNEEAERRWSEARREDCR
jgi:N-acetylmuramic acid 6-phosphate etherase